MHIKDIIVVGFALFAMFFGAGNLIFPTFLGVEAGGGWALGLIGFLISDIGLAILAIVAAAESDGDLTKLIGRAGKTLAVILGSAIMICLGPLLAIPRTAATTYEIGIHPLFGDVSQILFSIIFFIIVLLLTIKPSKVVDIIGAWLTPLLLIALFIIIIMGIVNPINDITISPRIENVFSEGITQGYLTMDALGAVALSTVIISSLKEKGFTTRRSRVKMALKSVILAAIGLSLVYGGLTYLGATMSTHYVDVALSDIAQTSIIVEITTRLLGNIGKTVLAVVIMLACLTTAIGLTSATGSYFSRLTKNKIHYEIIVSVVCIASALLSTVGVSTIIQFSSPILNIIYPATVTVIVLTILGGFITNDNVFVFSSYTALVISVITVISDLGIRGFDYIKLLPLSNFGFGWVIPVVIAAIVGAFIKSS